MRGLSRRNLALLCIGLLGLILRIVLSGISWGSNDATNWMNSAAIVREHGLAWAYSNDRFMTNPPLISLLVSATLTISERLSVPFPFLLRLLGILGEFGTGFLLFSAWRRRADLNTACLVYALYGLSLASLLVTGYSGHTDGVCIFLTLLGLFLVQERSRYFWGGLSIAGAINVKLIPILILPALILRMEPPKLARFLSGILLGLLPIFFAFASYGEPFFSKVINYNSILDYWGILMFLLLLQGDFPQQQDLFGSLLDTYHRYGKYLVILSLIGLSLWLKKRAAASVYVVSAMSYLLFSVLAPGFAIGYVTHIIPLLLLWSPKWGFRVSIISGVNLLVAYLLFLRSWYPLMSVHNSTSPKLGVLFGFFTWITLLVCFWTLIRENRTLSAATDR